MALETNLFLRDCLKEAMIPSNKILNCEVTVALKHTLNGVQECDQRALHIIGHIVGMTAVSYHIVMRSGDRGTSSTKIHFGKGQQ